MTSAFAAQLSACTRTHDLPVGLVSALIQVESDCNPLAWNPEPRYRWFWDVRKNAPFRRLSDAEVALKIPPSDFPCLAGDRDQEWWAQQASWGLMQIMGAVARERGCRSKYLTQLVDVDLNLAYGCRHLAHLRNRHLRSEGWNGVIAAYNTGGPFCGPGSAGEAYVRKIRAHWPV